MAPTFDTPGDQMPSGQLWGTRRKVIHSVGVTGKIKFISSGNNPYTGLLK